MIHIFLDTSVLLAFSRSKTGGSAYILELCEKGLLKGHVSKKVIVESRKNALEDMGKDAVHALEFVFKQGFLTIVPESTKEELEKARRAFDNPKDAPIIAAAKQAPYIEYILTLDNGFFKQNVLAYARPLEILKPRDFIHRFRSKLAEAR